MARRTQTAPLSALAAIRSQEFDEQPWGGHDGELLPRSPAPPTPEPLRIAPPDWAAEARERGDDVETEERLPLAEAVKAMVVAEKPEPDAPRTGGPVTLEPLRRFVPPEPDWREEEAEAERAEIVARAEAA